MSFKLPATKLVFALSGIGGVAAVAAAIFMSQHPRPEGPVFDPAPNPYSQGIYANGIVESDQASGSNVNVYPEVSGTVTQVVVHEGQRVRQGDALVRLDDRVQRATAQQQEAQAQAARAMLEELQAEPRPETLLVSQAQLSAALASAKLARDSYDKQQRAFEIDPHAVSRDALDSARNAWLVADANRATAQRQLDLTSAGAWAYDVRNQQSQVEALVKASQASRVLLDKYVLRAPRDGIVMAIKVSDGSYVNPQGVYDAYTQGSNAPVIVLGSGSDRLHVRCYVDEILIPRLPSPDKIQAQMFVRGTKARLALEFVGVEPYVSPKIALSDERLERVDVRVLPVIFSFRNTAQPSLYPGQLVDVYIGQ